MRQVSETKGVVATSDDDERGPPPRVYDVKTTARLLSLSPNTTYDLIRKKQIPSVRLGRRILVPREAIDDLLRIDKE